ncbi:MAG: Nif11 domain/cupin domain-containing protein [Cyanobacteriota bacterium]|nr:Nif11 domain/cupin domain-containing protein [Cyanobacteriota bacterium]
MAEADLQRFLDKIRQLNAFVALSESQPELRQELRACSQHDQVVALARRHGFEIGRRWGESAPRPAADGPADDGTSLLAGDPPAPGLERLTVLLATSELRLERIHSCAAVSPPGFWYEQEEDEWVCLLQGSAVLQFADDDQLCQLRVGDALHIKAGRRHRVVATDPPPGTIWLALFWRSSQPD